MITEPPHLSFRSRPWSFTAPVALLVLASFGCAPGDESDTDATAGDPAMGEQPMAQADPAPPCQFTASGDELRDRASPPDSATVQLGDATAKLCYGAPSMRERVVMRELVPFDEPWRMGANEPTTLHVPVAAEIGTVEVEPGSYSLYTVPGESEWEIVVNSSVDRWGIPIDAGVRESDVGSFTVEPESLDEPVEQMTLTMEPAGDGSATITMEWENTRVSFPLRPAAQ